MRRELLRKSQIAFGLAVVALLFLLETWNADRQMPNPASPYVWAVLGVLGGGALAAGFWFRWKASRAAP